MFRTWSIRHQITWHIFRPTSLGQVLQEKDSEKAGDIKTPVFAGPEEAIVIIPSFHQWLAKRHFTINVKL